MQIRPTSLLVALTCLLVPGQPTAAQNPQPIVADEWQHIATFGDKGQNITFYWKYGVKKASVRIKAVNNFANDNLTVKIRATGGGHSKDMTFYSIRPGKDQISVFCASMRDNACASAGNPSVKLLSAQ